MHLGHRRLVARAKIFGLPIGIMTIEDCKKAGDLFTVHEREEIFKSAGIDFVLEMPFLKIKDLGGLKFLVFLKVQKLKKIATGQEAVAANV